MNVNNKKTKIIIAVVAIIAIISVFLFFLLKPNKDYSSGEIGKIYYKIYPKDYRDNPYLEIKNNSNQELIKFYIEFEAKESLSINNTKNLYNYITGSEDNSIDKNYNKSRIKMTAGFDKKDNYYNFVSEGILPGAESKDKYYLYFDIYGDDLKTSYAFCDPDHNYSCTEWLDNYKYFSYFKPTKAYISFKNGDYVEDYVYDYKSDSLKKTATTKYQSEFDFVINILLAPFDDYKVKTKKKEMQNELDFYAIIYNVLPEEVEQLVDKSTERYLNGVTTHYDMWTTSDSYGNNHVIFSYHRLEKSLEIKLSHYKNINY